MADGGGLLGIDPSLLANLGLGLISSGAKNSPLRGNWGAGLQQGIGNYQALRAGNQDYQLNQQKLQEGQLNIAKTKQLFGLLGQMMGDPDQTASQGAPQTPPQSPQWAQAPQTAQAPAGAGSLPSYMQSQNAPQMPSAGQGATPPQLPPSLSIPSAQSIYSQPVGGFNPRALAGYNLLTGKDPITSLQETRKIQLQNAQESKAGTIAKLDTLIKSGNPAKYMQADPDLKGAWPLLAKNLGLDPGKDLNDQNVRDAFTFHRNAIASALQEPTVAPNVQEQTESGPLGSIYQTDPLTGKKTQVKGEEELSQVVGPNGPMLVPKSQAVGRQPFNATIFGASQMTDPAMEQAYQEYKLHGVMPQGYARNPIMNAKLTDYIAQRQLQEGGSVAQAAASGQDLHAAGQAVNEFNSTKANTAGGKLVAINTAVAHLDSLNPLIDAMKSGNLTLINRARQLYQKQTGQPAPTNYDALKNMAVGEVASAVNAGGGTGAERDEIAAPFKSANGPDVLRGAVEQAKTALAGKTEALRQRWDGTTRGVHGSFDQFLGPATKKALGVADQPASGGQSDLAAAAAAELAKRQGR